MNRLLILSALLLTPAPMTAAQQHSIVLPAGLADKCFQIDLSNIEQSTVPGRATPTEWEHASYSPLIVTFPGNEGSEFTVPHPSGKGCKLKDAAQVAFPPLEVYYSPFTNGECAGVVNIENEDETYQIILRFEQAGNNGSYSGTAEVVYRAAGESTHMRGGKFSIRPARKGDAAISLPAASVQAPDAGMPLNLNGKIDAEEGCVIYPTPENKAPRPDTPAKTVQSEDDGLRRLIQKLEKTTYTTAVERLYQRRLLTLLPQIAKGASTETVLPNANNSTALHYACGLSHAEIVQWLVDHGADLDAKTAKGAGVDDCVGGPNAKVIRAILRKARNKK